MNGRRNSGSWKARLHTIKRLAKLKLRIIKGLLYLKIHAPWAYKWVKCWDKQTRKMCEWERRNPFVVEGEYLDRMAIMHGTFRQKGETDEQLKTRLQEMLRNYSG